MRLEADQVEVETAEFEILQLDSRFAQADATEL